MLTRRRFGGCEFVTTDQRSVRDTSAGADHSGASVPDLAPQNGPAPLSSSRTCRYLRNHSATAGGRRLAGRHASKDGAATCGDALNMPKPTGLSVFVVDPAHQENGRPKLMAERGRTSLDKLDTAAVACRRRDSTWR